MAEFDSKLSAVKFTENINKVDSEGKTGVNRSQNNNNNNTAVESPNVIFIIKTRTCTF